MESVGFNITEDNMGPAINFACWAGMGLMCITVLVKTGTKVFGAGGQFMSFKYLQADDYFLGTAMLLGVMQNVSVMEAVVFGLGRHFDEISDENKDNYQKSKYASHILYVLTLGMAKLATFFFSSTLANTTAHRVGIWSTVFITMLWTLISSLTLAFQCPLPHVWEIHSGTCIDQRTAWYAIEAVNIFLEVNAAVLPTWFLWDLTLTWSKKGICVILFGLRVLAVPPFAIRLYFLGPAYGTSDPTYASIWLTIITQAAMNLSVVLAAIPFMKAVVDRIRPDWPSRDLRCLFGYNRSLYAASTSAFGGSGGDVRGSGARFGSPNRRGMTEDMQIGTGKPLGLGLGIGGSSSAGSSKVTLAERRGHGAPASMDLASGGMEKYRDSRMAFRPEDASLGVGRESARVYKPYRPRDSSLGPQVRESGLVAHARNSTLATQPRASVGPSARAGGRYESGQGLLANRMEMGYGGGGNHGGYTTPTPSVRGGNYGGYMTPTRVATPL